MASPAHVKLNESNQEARSILGHQCITIHERPTHIGPWQLVPKPEKPAARSLTRPVRPPLRPRARTELGPGHRDSLSSVLNSVDEQCRYIEAMTRWDLEQKVALEQQKLVRRAWVSAPATPIDTGNILWGSVESSSIQEKSSVILLEQSDAVTQNTRTSNLVMRAQASEQTHYSL